MRIKKTFLFVIIGLIAVLRCSETRLSGLASSGAGVNLQDIIEEDSVNEDNSAEEDQSAKEDNSDKKSNMKNLPESLSCTFVVPEDFYPSDTEPGSYFNEFYPLESANVTYSVSEIPQDKVLTNAQKEAGESAEAGDVEFRYDELTKEIYESIQKENYESLYGTEIGFTVESFENKDFDGFPGFIIRTSFTPEGSQMIHQVSAIVLSRNKVYTIVYSRADDDDFKVAIDNSIETIHVIGK